MIKVMLFVWSAGADPSGSREIVVPLNFEK
jgi:hypothetical protein